MATNCSAFDFWSAILSKSAISKTSNLLTALSSSAISTTGSDSLSLAAVKQNNVNFTLAY